MLAAMLRLLLIAALLAPHALAAAPRLAGPYEAEVVRVIDGDSFEARVTIWIDQEALTVVRLAGIDTAERGAPCLSARLAAEAARAFLAARIEGRRVSLSDIARDKYGGRILARASGEDGRDLGALLAASGLAHPYDGGRRSSWCAR